MLGSLLACAPLNQPELCETLMLGDATALSMQHVSFVHGYVD